MRRGRPFSSLPLDIEPPWSDPPEPDDEDEPSEDEKHERFCRGFVADLFTGDEEPF